MDHESRGNRWEISRREALKLGVGFAAASVFTKAAFADIPTATKVVKTSNGPVQGFQTLDGSGRCHRTGRALHAVTQWRLGCLLSR